MAAGSFLSLGRSASDLRSWPASKAKLSFFIGNVDMGDNHHLTLLFRKEQVHHPNPQNGTIKDLENYQSSLYAPVMAHWQDRRYKTTAQMMKVCVVSCKGSTTLSHHGTACSTYSGYDSTNVAIPLHDLDLLA